MARIIKKYANRRLYDTEASQHVTLEGVRELIVSGEDVVVKDDATGEDITRNILLQVILEQEQGGQPVLSTDMLKNIIRFYGNPMQGFMGQYLEQSMETFLNQQQAIQDQFQEAMTQGPVSAMQKMAGQNLEMWEQMQKAFLASMTPGRKSDPE